jgi:hypothetical protein
MTDKKFDEDDEKNVPYDLRQIYAKLVGNHLGDVAIQTKMQNFPKWLRAIEDLHTITRFKFDEPDEDDKQYQAIKQKVIQISNRFSSTWIGKNKDASEINIIEEALRELEDCLLTKMQDGGLFGRGFEYDEDEI